MRGYIYSKSKPTPKKNPKVIALSKSAMELLDLDINQLFKDEDNKVSQVLSGTVLLQES